MKRFRLSTLMLLVVIAALSFVVVMQQIRNARLMSMLEAMQARERMERAIAEAHLASAKAFSKAVADDLKALKGEAH
jgi:hypothetical protein